MTSPELILASKSASRRAMLEAAGIAFDTAPADLDERAIEARLAGAGPEAIALALLREVGQPVRWQPCPRTLAGLPLDRVDHPPGRRLRCGHTGGGQRLHRHRQAVR